LRDTAVLRRTYPSDESMFKMATRIQARAVRRCGELLKEFEPAKNQHDASTAAGTSRKQAAEEAGLSKRQKDTALRVATVPEEEFEAQIESDAPPTVTALAEQGTQKKVFDPFDLMDSGISFEDHKLATHIIGVGQELSTFSVTASPKKVWRGLRDYERADLLADLRLIRDWIDSLIILGEAELHDLRPAVPEAASPKEYLGRSSSPLAGPFPLRERCHFGSFLAEFSFPQVARMRCGQAAGSASTIENGRVAWHRRCSDFGAAGRESLSLPGKAINLPRNQLTNGKVPYVHTPPTGRAGLQL
jgi:hypothetical protein